jgi:hypothetical protein
MHLRLSDVERLALLVKLFRARHVGRAQFARAIKLSLRERQRGFALLERSRTRPQQMRKRRFRFGFATESGDDVTFSVVGPSEASGEREAEVSFCIFDSHFRKWKHELESGKSG